MSALNPFHASTRFTEKHVHIGLTGSVAICKIPDLLRSFLKLQIKVSATLTDGGRRFITPLLIRSLGADPVYSELFDLSSKVFAHLEPGASANVFLVAPASANFMARLAGGFASDMLSAQCLAFDGPVILAPAMNPRMWAAAATKCNVDTLLKRGCRLVYPAQGLVACGEEGTGRLADPQEIFLQTLASLAAQDLAGLKVMVTLGPTREMWDGARFFSNASSGRMGSSLVTAAWLRGAEVHAICGPGVDIFLPTEIKRINVQTAKEMAQAAHELWPRMDWGMFCAAVADFAPQRPDNADQLKAKKTKYADSFEIVMAHNPDILASCAAMRKAGQKILGFAAEITPNQDPLAALARAKLSGKKADMIAANRVNPGEGSFGSSESSMVIVDKNGLEEMWGPMAKADIAWELCSWLLRL